MWNLNIFVFILQVIHYADNKFTHADKEHFFKNCILKHSASRSKKNEKTNNNIIIPEQIQNETSDDVVDKNIIQ